MLKIIMQFYFSAKEKLRAGGDFEKIVKLPIREKISRLKYIEEDKLGEFEKISEELRKWK
jgi:V/A-type H+-transporting ATPase subunit A